MNDQIAEEAARRMAYAYAPMFKQFKNEAELAKEFEPYFLTTIEKATDILRQELSQAEACIQTLTESRAAHASEPQDAKQLAVTFHNIYERLAPDFGYETRKETRDFDPTTPNGRLMIAVCDEILKYHLPRAAHASELEKAMQHPGIYEVEQAHADELTDVRCPVCRSEISIDYYRLQPAHASEQ